MSLTALENLKTLLKNTTAFQDWVGADSATNAGKHIHILSIKDNEFADLDDPESPVSGNTRPFALITYGDNSNRKRVADNSWENSGSINVLFEDEIDSDEKDMPEYIIAGEFMRKIDLINDGVEELSNDDGYMYITSIDQIGSCERSVEEKTDNEKDLIQVWFSYSWW